MLKKKRIFALKYMSTIFVYTFLKFTIDINCMRHSNINIRILLTSELMHVLYNAAYASIDMHQSRNSCCELGFVIKKQEKLETSCC